MSEYASLVIGGMSGLLVFLAIAVRMHRNKRKQAFSGQPPLPFNSNEGVRSGKDFVTH